MNNKLKQRVVFDANDVSALVGLHRYRYDDIPNLVKKNIKLELCLITTGMNSAQEKKTRRNI